MADRGARLRFCICWAILVAAVLVPYFLYGERIDGFVRDFVNAHAENRAIVAGVLFGVLASDIFLPVPSCLVSTMCGLFLGPYLGFAASFLAMSLSSLVGFLIGRFVNCLSLRLIGSNLSVLDEHSASRRPFFLFIYRPLPVLSECSAVYAGLRRYPFAASFMWISLGNAVVSAVYVVIGHFGRCSDSFMPAFVAVAALSAIMLLINRKFFLKR